MRAIGHYADGTTRSLTRSVNWISDDPNVAQVFNDPASEGLVIGVARGQTTIRARDLSTGKFADAPIAVIVE